MRGGHGVAAAVRGGRIRGMRAPRAFVIQARPGDVVVRVAAILRAINS